MYPISIVAEAMLNGLLTGAVYALVALGLTLVYGVLHIINFAHGAFLTVAMFAVWLGYTVLGMNPYLMILPLSAVFFVLGYAVQRPGDRAGQPRRRRQHPAGDAGHLDRHREPAAGGLSVGHPLDPDRHLVSGG
ncbi:MAG: hypothetical protein M5U35_10610 [Roseovarius sp.]|nr:hypothetical protein [Roseovarius sp.]